MLVVLNANGFEPMEERTRDTSSRTVFGPGPVGPAELDSAQEFEEIVSCQSGLFDDTEQGPRIDLIMPRYDHPSLAVSRRQGDVAATLSDDAKPLS